MTGRDATLRETPRGAHRPVRSAPPPPLQNMGSILQWPPRRGVFEICTAPTDSSVTECVSSRPVTTRQRRAGSDRANATSSPLRPIQAAVTRLQRGCHKREAEELSLAGSERCHRCRVGLLCAPVVSFSPQKRRFDRQPPSGLSKRPLQGFKGRRKRVAPRWVWVGGI